MKTIFFYGLFMDDALLLAKGIQVYHVQSARAEGYQLNIGARATLVTNKDASAYGKLMDLSPEDVARLYSADGVEDYVSQTIKVTMSDGERREVDCYILPQELLTGSNSQYARELANVADKLGLPEAYIKEIKTWI